MTALTQTVAALKGRKLATYKPAPTPLQRDSFAPTLDTFLQAEPKQAELILSEPKLAEPTQAKPVEDETTQVKSENWKSNSH